MTPKAKAETLVKLYGATMEVDRTGETSRVAIEAPLGQVWLCSEVHELVDSVNKPYANDWQDLLQRMGWGLKACPYGAACEWCNPTDD